MLAGKKVLGLIAVLCAGILPLVTALWSLNTFQTQDTKLLIDPPSIVYGTLIPGKRFSINITVANVIALKGYELKLSFNTVMLDVVSIVLLPEENLPIGDFSVDDTAGIVWMSVIYAGNSLTTEEPVALASITFKMMNRGESLLHLYDTRLENSSGELIPHGTVDGIVLILRRDVLIVSVTPSTNEVYIGQNVSVTVIAKNDGDVPENFTVKAYHNDTIFDTFEVIDLASGENTTIIFKWNTSDVTAGYSYTLKAEATEVPFEANTTNNVFVDSAVKVKIIGDVNNDNIVDIDDLIAWDAAYGSSDPQADVNGDGTVDKEDGILIIQNYHSTPP